MNSPKQLPERDQEWETSVPDHYAALTTQMLNFGGDLLACHFGLWGPDTTDEREALLRANRALVQGCDLGPGQRVLDAGCGVGGTAITVNRLSILTPNRRAKLTPLSGTAEVVPVANRGDPRGFV